MQMMYDKSSDMYDMNLGLWCWSQDCLPLLYNILRAFYWVIIIKGNNNNDKCMTASRFALMLCFDSYS